MTDDLTMEKTRRYPYRSRPNNVKLNEGLLEAMKIGNVDEVIQLIHTDRIINRRLIYKEGHETKEFTPLCMAIEHADICMVKQLLLAGADPEKHSMKTSRAPWGRMYVSRMKLTPLYLAVKQEKIDIIHLLVEQGASPDVSWGYCRENEEEYGSVDYIEMTDVPDPEGHHDTVLHVAMRCNLPESASALLRAGANATCINQRGESPLHLACQHGASPTCKLVQLIVHHGGICESRDSSGLTPLQHFVSSFISLCGKKLDIEHVKLTLVSLLDAGYQLDNESWLRNLRQIQTNFDAPSHTWSLNFIFRTLTTTLGNDALQMLFNWDYRVKSLTVLSRIAVRRTLGSVKVRAKVDTLPLPLIVKVDL